MSASMSHRLDCSARSAPRGVLAWSLGLLATLALPAIAAAQRTWIVDKLRRPGWNFADLTAATTQAQPGDTLFVRAVGPDRVADAYQSPALYIEKGLRYVGEQGSYPVWVRFSWFIRNIPVGQELVLARLMLTGDGYPSQSAIQATNCAGPITMDRMVAGGLFTAAPGGNLAPTHFVDCNLVTFTHCTLDVGDSAWGFVRTKLMLDDTVMTHGGTNLLTGIWRPGTIEATDSEVWIAGGRIEGPTPWLAAYGTLASEPLYLCHTPVHLGGGAQLVGGTSWAGYQYGGFNNSCWQDPAWPDAYIDPSVQIVSGQLGRVTLHPGPQTMVRYAKTATTLQIDQHFSQAQGATLLLIGALQPVPWYADIGPVFVEPTTAWADLRLPLHAGPVQYTFALPPGLPAGLELAVQAFTWLPPATFLTSNATVVGFW